MKDGEVEFKSHLMVGKMAHQMKAHVAKPADPGSIPGTHDRTDS